LTSTSSRILSSPVRPYDVLPAADGSFDLVGFATASADGIEYEPLAQGIPDVETALVLAAAPPLLQAARRSFLLLQRLRPYLGIKTPTALMAEVGETFNDLLGSLDVAGAAGPTLPPDRPTADVGEELGVELELPVTVEWEGARQ
jgi:hypothetical protein